MDDQGNVDEIKQYRDARWVTPPEALWRIYGFDLSKNYPPVKQLQLHLPDMHMVSFHERQKIENVVNRPGADESMLTTYFVAGLEVYCTVISLSISHGNQMVNFGNQEK